jgi:hypothetical protein
MSNTKFKNTAIVVLGLLFLVTGMIKAENNNKEKRKLQKVYSLQNTNARIDINNLNALESNVGYSDYNLNSNLEGLEFPKGSGKNAVFEAGFLWGGFVRGDTSGQVRVGGSAYITGLEPGPILANGKPADPTDAKWSIYTVRSDVYPGGPDVDLSSEVAAYAEGGQTVTAEQLRAQYEANWTNWPAAGTANDLGAPFQDVNGDGKYEPNIDIPGVPGADQTIYFVANDLDTLQCLSLYGTQPMGIEVHVTYWAYAQQGALGNMYFKKWDIINKGYQKNIIDSMFVSYWTDVDLGYAGDDLVGCDTTLSLQFAYNGEANDQVYAPLPPPADGFDFFQGPVVNGSPSDSAVFIKQPFVFNYIHGKKNLPMTAAYFFINGDANFNDPPQGAPTGATQFYHFFNGQYGLSGLEFQDPWGNKTPFAFPGDPTKPFGPGNWTDGVTNPPADRRQGMASGPFTLMPGDTQEVVVAEMFAGAIPTVNYLQAVTLVKTYDKTAQNAYDHFFNLPTPPPPPHVVATPLNNKINLDWGEVASFVSATENSVVHDVLDSIDVTGGGDYKFEGYNVYQLPYKSATIDQAKLIATYDVIDSVKTIPFVDLATRQVNPSYYIEYGTDSGIQRYFVDSTDAFNGNGQLHNGTPYYFAVTAYSYNPKGVPRALENPISVITVTPQSNNPGVTMANLGPISIVNHTGTADASVGINVVNPTATTGHQYQVSFHDEKYTLGSNGVWTDITTPSSRLAKTTDLTGSSLSAAAVWSENKGAILLHYLVNVVSPNYDYCDGVAIKFPSGIVIDSIFSPISNNTGSAIPYTFNSSTNTVFFGDSSRSQNGIFAGGEDIVIQVHPGTPLPIITNYTMYDDNFGAMNGYGGSLVDVSGTDTVSSVANQMVTQHQWNVTDLNTGTIVLKNQTIYNGVDIYDPATYMKSNGIFGPGGSSHSNGGIDVGVNAVNFDGIQVNVNGSFAAPTTIGSLLLNGKPLAINSSSARFTITDFTDFGYADGTAATSLPIYGGAGGVPPTDINDLQQDYELKWTGVVGDTVINGQHVEITKSGGSIATIFGSSNYSLANHPLNPTPGVKAPFTIRIPFEVWNTVKNEQVNLLVYDRNYSKYNQPGVAADTFQVWNTRDRMYTWVVNTKYSPTLIDPKSTIVADSATWNWVFFTSYFKTGDDIKIIYNNPLQIGKDIFTFTVPGTHYSDTLAQQQVSQINVFPNPYYGVNPLETNKYARFVTFSHLPKVATIRIFNLAGIMVRTINHTDGTQFQQWDLKNDSGLPVGSGLYIAYIDMPGIGKKILKFAIIQEQQYPDHF